MEFEPQVTLGTRDDPAGPGVLAEVLDMGDQGYLVSSDILGGVVIVYDEEGRYQRELTREGEGPGELIAAPHFAIGTGGILMFEPGHVARSMQPGAGAANLRGWQAAIRGTDGMIWTSSPFGLVELYDEDLAPLDSIQLELPGMEGWEAPRDGRPIGWPAQVNDIRLAPDGSGLWVFAMAPEERLAALSVEELRDEMMANAANAGAVEQVADAYVYWIRLDPDGLTLMGRDNFDTLVRPLGDGDLAYDLFETPDGNRRVRVGRLSLTRTAPGSPDS
ncbi:MAG: hypothetical protein OXQ94_06660 [Gemmatimonadota bacterium]|nr:hypothetical protein [Gemmatimonadota bacterium]MDE2871355.1 hypothetical protein [Gemmatimonadota bacterium]